MMLKRGFQTIQPKSCILLRITSCGVDCFTCACGSLNITNSDQKMLHVQYQKAGALFRGSCAGVERARRLLFERISFRCHVSRRTYSPPQVDRIWGIWGSYYNLPKAIFYLLKGEYIHLFVSEVATQNSVKLLWVLNQQPAP